MDKYRKIMRAREETTVEENEIRVTAVGSVSAYVSRVAKVFDELKMTHVVISGTGNALTKAVTLTEVAKRRFKGLHQITSVSSIDVVDEYEPLEEGLEKVSEVRTLPHIEIKLSKEALDESAVGYQAPLDESEVKEMDLEELMKPRGRGKGRGKGKGGSSGKGSPKGKGRGKGRDSPKGKGKGKGKDSPKGKGKGKGKDYSPKGKEKGSPKGKGKGKDSPKGKGKGKGYDRDDRYSSSYGRDSGKGGSKGYGGSRGGWDSDYPPTRGSGKGSSGGSGWDSWSHGGERDWDQGWGGSSYSNRGSGDRYSRDRY